MGAEEMYLLPAGTERPKVKADVKFLVVEISITNTSRSASRAPVYYVHLKDSEGREYAEKAIWVGGAAQGILGGKTVNPDMSVRQRLIFDVPQKEGYSLLFSEFGEYMKRGKDILLWKLRPTSGS
jgi:hypothetical protein